MGDVGEGIGTLFGEWFGNDPPCIDDARVFDAAVAAAEGSSELVSARVLPSCIVFGRCVGELFLGVEPRKSFLENVRERLDFSGPVWVILGDARSC